MEITHLVLMNVVFLMGITRLVQMSGVLMGITLHAQMSVEFYMGITRLYRRVWCPTGDNSSCTDECGVLYGDNSSCIDECGVPNGDNSSCTDECGVVNGDNSSCADECGVPNGDNSSCLDCAGVVNGTLEDLGCGCGNPAAQVGYHCDGNLIQIGDQHAGGMVFQINEDGSGLVAGPQWKYNNNRGQVTWLGAMNAAASSSWGGYNDWYLPNLNELQLMCNTIGAGADNIGNFTTSESATTTNDGFYWTRNQTNGGTHARPSVFGRRVYHHQYSSVQLHKCSYYSRFLTI